MDHKIKTFEDACHALNIETKLPDVAALLEKHRKAITAHYMLVIIAEALNEGWEPNWNDSNEYKYFPWFEIEASEEKPSGFGFSGSGCACTDTSTDLGSRLCFKSSELAMYAGEQFKELYIDYFLLQK